MIHSKGRCRALQLWPSLSFPPLVTKWVKEQVCCRWNVWQSVIEFMRRWRSNMCTKPTLEPKALLFMTMSTPLLFLHGVSVDGSAFSVLSFGAYLFFFSCSPLLSHPLLGKYGKNALSSPYVWEAPWSGHFWNDFAEKISRACRRKSMVLKWLLQARKVASYAFSHCPLQAPIPVPSDVGEQRHVVETPPLDLLASIGLFLKLHWILQKQGYISVAYSLYTISC